MPDRGETPDARPTLVVPLFPLPATVLFPRVRQPFYIFEPRYRAMLRDALDGDGLIGIPLLGGMEGKANETPEIANVFGVGEVVDYETLPDGTSNIEVLGRHRVAMLDELPPSEYRRARVTVLADESVGAPDAKKLHDELEAAFLGLDRVGLTREAKEAIGQIFKRAGEDVAFLVHMLCTIVIGSPEIRQKLLEEDSLLHRGRGLLTILDTLRQELGRPFRDV